MSREKIKGIDLNFNNACNLRCKYCFTNSPKGDHVKEYLDYAESGGDISTIQNSLDISNSFDECF